MKKINIISEVEMNDFANLSLANNGGGYHQPQFKFVYDGLEGVFSDSSCGDFGSRYSLDFNGKQFRWGSMLGNREQDVHMDVKDLAFYKEFVGAFLSAFGKKVPFIYFDENEGEYMDFDGNIVD